MGAFPARCRRRRAGMGGDGSGGLRAGGSCVDGCHHPCGGQAASRRRSKVRGVGHRAFVRRVAHGLIYEMAVRSMLFGRFAVRIEGGRLDGTLWGEPVDVARHAPACEPKGATYTALKVSKNVDGMWSAACIVDV